MAERAASIAGVVHDDSAQGVELLSVAHGLRQDVREVVVSAHASPLTVISLVLSTSPSHAKQFHALRRIIMNDPRN